MLTVSGRWAASLRQNHTPIHRIELWRTGSLLIPDLPIVSASVVKDASTSPRTQASVEIADTSTRTAQLATPFGNRLKFFKGLRYPDNTTELVQVADLDIVGSNLSRGPDGTSLSVSCADPAQRIGEDTLPGPARQRDLAGVQDAISWLIARTNYYGGKVLQDSSGVTRALARDWVADGDPWDSIEQLADSIGAECYFTPQRDPVLRPVPSVKATADAVLYALDGGSVEAISSDLTRAPNVIYVFGAPDETTGKASRGVAADTAVTSPTAHQGPYGRIVQVETRPTPMTPAQAQSAAVALLRRIQGRVRSVTLEAVPDPAIEPGDTVAVRFAGGAIERHLVQSVTIPFGADETMMVTTRTTTYTTGGWP